MARFAAQNDSFCRAKRAILRFKTGRFEKQEDFSLHFVRISYQRKSFRHRRIKKLPDTIFRSKLFTRAARLPLLVRFRSPVSARGESYFTTTFLPLFT
jgi:hypothetical protein